MSMLYGILDQKELARIDSDKILKIYYHKDPTIQSKKYSDEFINFSYFEFNVTDKNDNKKDIYILPYGVDLGRKQEKSFRLMYDNFFTYYKKPTVVISLTGLKIKSKLSSDESVYDFIVDRIAKFINCQNINASTIMGASLGGRIAISLARRIGKNLNKAVIWDPPGIKPETIAVDFLKILAFDKYYNLSLKNDKLSRSLSKGYNTAKLLKRHLENHRVEISIMKELSNKSLEEEVTDLNSKGIETVLLFGEDSVFARNIDSFAKSVQDLKNLSLVILTDAGHYIGTDVSTVNRALVLIELGKIYNHPAYITRQII